MGGMEGLGSIEIEENEPVFHHDWERRVFAINIGSLWATGPVDRIRHATERLDPAFYLTASYYEKWLASFELNFRDLGVLSDEEMASGEVQSEFSLPHPTPSAEQYEGIIRGGMPASRDTGRQEPRFQVGDTVLTINDQPHGHTRLPRYARGRTGTITIIHGTHVLPDTAAHDLGENPQPLYNVRFEGKELWGGSSTGSDCVYLDLWEDYLQPIT
jgi:nitrile hydratase